MRLFVTLTLLAAGLAGRPAVADWKPAPAPLMTEWGKKVTPEAAWPEYPRPQLVRKDWQNLNGLWDYAITPKGVGKPEAFAGQILVPYCVESALSGVGKRVGEAQYLWYRRQIQCPPAWAGKRVLLHFGAVDWESVVSVNGKELVTHRGGSDPFTVDVTDALKDGAGELVVRVWDPTDRGSQPRGKQVNKPEGIWYTPVTGIWQTAWLEPVPEKSVAQVVCTPNLDAGAVKVTVTGRGAPTPFKAEVLDGGAAVATFDGVTDGEPVTVTVPNVKAWSPDAPHLYGLRLKLDGDEVESYFTVRKIHVAAGPDGIARLMLNNKPLFQFGPLDQGYWPDGLLTPPSDAAMKSDVEVLKKLGFNMLRKHIKVEPARYYRYCDELGMLVWQDMPSGFLPATQGVNQGQPNDAPFTDADDKQFRAELKAMIDHLRGFGCITTWVPFNEGWGQHSTNEILKWVKEYDPSRVVNGPSGWMDRGYGDTIDAHRYPWPGMWPTSKDRASVLGEFGGLGLPVKGHLWQGRDNWGYETYQTPEALANAYRLATRKLHPLVGRGLSAAVYTQTTDVEGEINGLMTYDRAVVKIDPAKVKAWHDELQGPAPVLTELTPTSEAAAQQWQYRFTKPAANWATAADADGWKTGAGGFGTRGTPNAVIGTEWNTADIWVRREVELKAAPTGEVFVRMYHDEDAEVYLNGVLAVTARNYNGNYDEFPVTAAGRAALKAGKNTIAIHCHQTRGGQAIDAGLVELLPAKGK